ncbi:RNA 2'-phosphotransferase [Paludibacterium paludis]|uniref:Probable RNA 2'-phosphotransferase n=1 Tax=Paludibacterium paludis TaxID=1225769 RepID=A0A918P5Y5_9NEIS|nr:RNA 2'-phosphotransferase [Paludibacterium paludis]GGY23494.1 putative RNA 2'-phosphotransferase [Paludibacterium paludis]
MDTGSISKLVSHALRHEPWLYELELDDKGWVPVEELLSASRSEKPEWSALKEPDLAAMIANSDKKRHELLDGKIRALYGHSVPNKLLKQPAEPPAVLYHGTSPETVALIRASGLQPMDRQYVHLSVDTATAEQVGRRKARFPVLLEVQAKVAAANGVAFYRGNDLVWLADQVPVQFIEFPD